MSITRREMLLIAVLAILLEGITLWMLYQRPQLQITVFDKRQTVRLFIAQAAKEALTKEKMRALSKRFQNAMNSSLEEYATKHHLVILNQTDVFGATKNVTSDIQAMIAQKVRGSHD